LYTYYNLKNTTIKPTRKINKQSSQKLHKITLTRALKKKPHFSKLKTTELMNRRLIRAVQILSKEKGGSWKSKPNNNES